MYFNKNINIFSIKSILNNAYFKNVKDYNIKFLKMKYLLNYYDTYYIL